MAFKGGSNALAAMLKSRTDNGMVVITEENAAKLPHAAVPHLSKQVSINHEPVKCVACAKSVFKMEEIIAMGHSWHGSCFTCGGSNTDGCKRKLVRDGFVENHGQPYCKACFEKNKVKHAEERKEQVEEISRPLSALFLKKQQQKNDADVNSHLGAVMSADFLQPAQFGRSGSIIRPLPPTPGGAAAVVQTPKCPACTKTVYKMEEIIAIGASWHSTCFCCGGTNSDGCKRKLVRDNFTENNGMPYCKPCYDKLFRSWVKVSKAAANDNLAAMLVNKRVSAKLLAGSIVTGNNNVSVDSGDANGAVLTKVLASNAAAAPLYAPSTTEAPVWSANVSAARTKYIGKTTPFNPANKCVKCTKTVYKMEEMIAVGQVWHKQCFCCGGLNSDGCNRVLSRDGYVDHNAQPYCNACYNKQFRTKGFGIGTELNTDYGVK